MEPEQSDKLLNRYYKGEASLEEEALLKAEMRKKGRTSPESDAFAYYEKEGQIPETFEDELFNSVLSREKERRRKIRYIKVIGAVAASLAIVISIFLDVKIKRQRDMENRFATMEQAMYQVSETLQPQEQDNMFVLWVDDNVEIIIN